MRAGRSLGVLVATMLVGVFAVAAIAGAAPVTIQNDVAPAAQFNVTGPETEMHAHGGGMIKHGDYYYWYGEWRNSNGTVNRIPVYRSTDLKNWEYRGAALSASQVAHLTSPNIERPKVIYNATTGNFVMWMHLETNGNYSAAQAAIAVSTTGPEGPFIWHSNGRPNVTVSGASGSSHMSRDQTVFVDDNGAAYMISAADENADLHLYRLNDTYTGYAASGHYVVWADQSREAPIMFKRDGVYFLLTSAATGWSPNQQMYATSTNIAGGSGTWSQPTPIPFGNQSAYETQGAHLIAVQGTEATSYLYLADRWGGSFSSTVMNSRYVWLPLDFPTANSLDMKWADTVTIDTETGVVTGKQNAPPAGSKWPVTNLAVGSTSDAEQGSHWPFIHGWHVNNAENTVDGRQETNWISTGTQADAWARFDLGEPRAIDTVRLMLFRGGIRSHQLQIQAGLTTGAMSTVWSGTTPMKTGFHELPLNGGDGVTARYVTVRTTGTGSGDSGSSMAPGSSLGIVEAEIYDTKAEPLGTCTPLRSDDFESGALDTDKWTFRHPTTPATGPNAPEVAGGKLRLRAVQGELPNENISFIGQPLPPGNYWTATAKISFNPTAVWQHAGILLYGDNDDYARITFTRNNSTGQRFFELVSYVNGTRTQSNQGSLDGDHGNEVRVRLSRIGNQLSVRYQGRGAYYIAQGGVWLPQGKTEMNDFLGSVNLSLNTRTGAGARIGPYAAGGAAGDGNPVAEFDYFQLTPDDEITNCGADTEIDTEPPVTTHEYKELTSPAVPPLLPGDRYSALYDPEFTIDATDALSGVASTTFCIGTSETPCDPTTPVTDGSIVVSGLGEHLVRYRSTDVAGNQEAIREFTVEIVEHPHSLSFNGLPAARTFGSTDLTFNVETSVNWPSVHDSPPVVEATGPCEVGATGAHVENTGWPIGLSITGAGTCTVSASHAGMADLVEPADAVVHTLTVAKATPAVKLTLKTKKVKSGKKATITVQVSGPGAKNGTVRIKVGGKSKTVNVNANGKATYKVKVTGKRGKKLKVQATYNASANLASAKSKVANVTIK